MIERNPFKTIIVTGVPGVGKTTVLSIVDKMLTDKAINHLILNFGDFMLEEAKRLGLVEHRDQLRHLPLRKQLELQEYAAKSIVSHASSRLDPEGVLLVDTHAVIKTDTGYWPGLPRGVVTELKPDSIVLIESRPEDIVARQRRDKTRVRSDLASIDVVKTLMEMARSAAMASAVEVAASVYITMNVEGDPSSAARDIVSLIEKLM
ncbi:MAG: adenylate kinase [Pyrodictiaceae archaeon]